MLTLLRIERVGRGFGIAGLEGRKGGLDFHVIVPLAAVIA